MHPDLWGGCGLGIRKMPIEKLVNWYEYGLFIQAHPTFTLMQDRATEAELQLLDELAAWEAASDEDWLKLEAIRREEE